jgi:hypothetical protein
MRTFRIADNISYMEDYAYESVYTVVSLLTQYFPMIRMVTSTPEMKYINGSYLIKFHLDSGVKYYHSVDFAKAPHIMTIGGTGSGKTYLNQLIVAKVSLEDKYAEGTILDFKGQDYQFAKGTKKIYEYDSNIGSNGALIQCTLFDINPKTRC